ncbi:deoxyuridine triphosphatase [Gordonia phage Archimedes]|uniref:Deoxyuridine triphosphatase n=1 Tax=Gordonia phage Archimedes TaxID=2759389 RepID=A0A7L7SH36_9CAUD|nr:deoxyuridine triphosphatase [Gordonia phage Archimedes]QOC55753.1 deoxyuridine triphosphatase [Gordonia phage Archimedes]
MNTLIYYAHPIDQSTGSENLRRVDDAIKSALGQLDQFVLFDPGHAWKISDAADPDSSIQLANMRLIANSVDVVLVAAPAGVPTIGTWLEVMHALDCRKQVVIVTDISRSWALEYLATKENCNVVSLNNVTETTHADEIRRLINAT